MNDQVASAPSPHAAFRWTCLALAAAVSGYLCWAVEDLRRGAKTSSQAVNQHLPEILEKVNGTTQILKEVADDLKKLRDLAGAAGPRDASLAVFADRLLDRLQAADVRVGASKVVGKGAKDLVSAAEWVRGARKEALWLTFRARGKGELLERLCKTKFGYPWLVVRQGEKPIRMQAWFAEHDEEVRALLETK